MSNKIISVTDNQLSQMVNSMVDFDLPVICDSKGNFSCEGFNKKLKKSVSIFKSTKIKDDEHSVACDKNLFTES